MLIDLINKNNNFNEIQSYIQNIEDYGKEVRKMDLTQTELLMKVTDDMWGSIKGYGNPKKDLIGFMGLDLATEEGVGVCRNMAEDVARKLNAIDEEYNARVINVYYSGEGYEIANIDRNIIKEDEEKKETKEQNTDAEETIGEDSTLTKIVGNHAVVALDIKEDNATLILDPTNPGIGVYQNGKVTMFNSKGVDYKPTQTLNWLNRGIDAFNIPIEYISSFKITNLNYDELNEKYGVEAQNKALDSVREKEKTFKDTIKITVGDKTAQIDLSNIENRENIKTEDNERDK